MKDKISDGQALALVASFAVDTPWKKLPVDVQPFLELSPRVRAERLAAFVANGFRVGVPEYEIAYKYTDPGYEISQGGALLVYLKNDGNLDRVYSSEDTLIQGWLADPSTYPDEFKNRFVVLWGSVAPDTTGNWRGGLGVMCLFWKDGGLELHPVQLHQSQDSRYLTLLKKNV